MFRIMYLFFRFRKHREKVAKRKNEGDEQSEYQQTHQTIKRRISDSELENSSISSSPTPSFEPMDLSGSKSYTKAEFNWYLTRP